MPSYNFKKLNLLKKLQVKLSNKEEYKKYKFELKEYKLYEKRKQLLLCLQNNKQLFNPIIIKQLALKNNSIHFSHTGNAGDIIYALPTLKSIALLIEKPVSIYFIVNQAREPHPIYSHPLGSVRLNIKMAEMLIPLINCQEYIDTCGVFQDQRIDIGLENIREAGLRLDRGNITRWYSYLTGVHVNTSQRWLVIKRDANSNNKIIIARSERYRNRFIDYSFLKKYSNLLFVGLNNEFEDMKNAIPNLQWQPVNDFLELAEIIAGCKLFIGNQSFPFAIAEGLKVPRILEKDFEEPNVIPEGDNSHEYYFQEHFEYLVDNIINCK